MDKLLEILPNVVALLCPNLEENTQSLQKRIKSLKSRKDDIDEELRHSGKKRRREVENWMDDVEDNKKDIETLEQEVRQSSRFYHFFKRQKLDQRIERMKEEVTKLEERKDFSSGLCLEVDESAGPLWLTSQPNGQAFLKNFKDIWTSLMDDGILSIGIYGMGGVGKTTLAKCVHDKLLNEDTFSDHVYWVTVSREFRNHKLQSKIAEALKLKFSCGSDVKKRAAQLFQAFEKKERFVLILDDVWKQIDAAKIGIPFNRDGCQLVVTSRSEEVCHRMCCKKIIKVNTLSYQEAKDLFFKTLHRDGLSVELKEICEKMVIRCGGLPLALVTLAGSMRGVTDIYGWRDALEGLKQSCSGQADMKEDVLNILLYSYRQLRDTRLRSCFLYCSLYPEDFRISRDEVIKDFISEELMEPRLSWQAEVDQGHAILNQLVRACLLEWVSDKHVKMHDLIREMAIEITKANPRYMVQAGLNLKELPEEQKWTEDLDKVSLMTNSIEEISPGTSPKCPSLSTLILRINPLRLIPDCFFTHMRGLRTLDLSATRIESLPNSISDLEKLNALLLRYCSKLESVPSLEKLKVLRRLDLTDTIIEEVPQGMESLTNLKSLYLSCSRLKMIPMGTLQRLTHLQQLVLPYPLDVPIEEVETLKQLEVFQCRLNSVRDLNRLINSRQIDKPLHFYNIIIGSRGMYIGTQHSLPCKHLHFGEDSLMESSLDTDENMLPRNFENLFFSSSGLSGCLLDEFPILNSAGDLKECEIKREDKIEYIMRLEEEQKFSGVPFQSLERLNLSGLPNLIGLFKWEAVAAPLPPDTFSCLKYLSIQGCGKIKKLFPQSAVHNFRNLQSLTVEDCVQMEEIIERQQSSTGVPFQILEHLYLGSLPNLIGLFKWEAVAAPLPPGTFSCLKSLFIKGCGKIKKLFPQSAVHNFRNLQSLIVEDCVQIEEIIEQEQSSTWVPFQSLKHLTLTNLPNLIGLFKWEAVAAPLPPDTFSCLQNLFIKGCGKIKKLFPQSVVHNLCNLKFLTINNCVQMEEIIEEQQSSTGVPFQILEHLYLGSLPNLIGLFKWEAVAAPLPPGTFSCLKYLSIQGCGKIKKLFPQSAVHNFRNLQSLTVEDCVQMEEIIERQQSSTRVLFQSLERLKLTDLPNLIGLFKWEAVVAPLPLGTFSCLKDLSIERCGKIKKLFPQSAVHNFLNLQSLAVKDCVQMEEIIEQQQSSTGVPFQSLEHLKLTDLPNLIGLFKWEAVVAPLPPITFSCLKYLSIQGCGKIKKLFPQSAVHNFRNLQSLTVEDCVQMEEIIEQQQSSTGVPFQSLEL